MRILMYLFVTSLACSCASPAETDNPMEGELAPVQGSPGAGCDYYSAPFAQEGGDGSFSRPWGPLSEIAQQGTLPNSGQLCLLNGDHGVVTITQYTGPLVIKSLNRRRARIGTLQLKSVNNVVFEGIIFDGRMVIDTTTADDRQRFLVTASKDSRFVTFRDVIVQSAPRSDRWTWNDWHNLVRSGFDLKGGDMVVEDSLIRNIYHAAQFGGDRAHMSGSTIDNFGGDAIRGLGSGSTYEWNIVRDSYIDEYDVQHDDLFQAFELEGDRRISDVTIRNNKFIFFADPVTDFVKRERLAATLTQGIIITDGYADGWVVENNLVVNAQSHGISLFGARHCRIQNNTVIRHPAFPNDAGPWILIRDQRKTGQANFENIIRNNITTMLTPWDYDETSTIEANIEAKDPTTHFVNYSALDFRLRWGSEAVNSGVNTTLSDVDLAGKPRWIGDRVDLGAFEQQ